MQELRLKIRAIILAVTGLIISLLIVRFFLAMFAADPNQPVVQLFYSLTDPLVAPFVPDAAVPIIGSLDFGLLLSIAVYLVSGVLIAGIIGSFLHEKPGEIIINLVDSIFKIFEFLLISRLIFSLFAIPLSASQFVSFIYDATSWSAGIFEPVEFFTGELELSVLAVLAVLVIVDVATEQVVTALFAPKPEENTTIATAPSTQIQHIEPQPKTQTINITVPVQQPYPQPQQAYPSAQPYQPVSPVRPWVDPKPTSRRLP